MKHGGSKSRTRLLLWLCAGWLAASLPSAAKKGPKVSVGDDPVLGESTAELVLIEVADFQ